MQLFLLEDLGNCLQIPPTFQASRNRWQQIVLSKGQVIGEHTHRRSRWTVFSCRPTEVYQGLLHQVPPTEMVWLRQRAASWFPSSLQEWCPCLSIREEKVNCLHSGLRGPARTKQTLVSLQDEGRRGLAKEEQMIDRPKCTNELYSNCAEENSECLAAWGIHHHFITRRQAGVRSIEMWGGPNMTSLAVYMLAHWNRKWAGLDLQKYPSRRL